MTMTRVDPPAEPVEMPWLVFEPLRTGDAVFYLWVTDAILDDAPVMASLIENELQARLDGALHESSRDPADYDKQWVLLRPRHFKPDIFGQKFTDQYAVYGAGNVACAAAKRVRGTDPAAGPGLFYETDE